jgi:hypothetical protein
MEKEIFPIKKTESIEPASPEDSGLVIEEILKKYYKLANAQEEGIEKILQSKNSQERKEIFENLPGTKISKLVREYAEGKVSLKDFTSRLEEEINIISKKEAKQIAEELEKTLLVRIKPVKKEIKKEGVPSPKIPPTEVKPPVIPLEEPEPEKPEVPPKPDIYREPIE